MNLFLKKNSWKCGKSVWKIRQLQVDAKKVRATGNSNAVLEIAKYSAKGTDLYHSEAVFDMFYIALKKRQLLVIQE